MDKPFFAINNLSVAFAGSSKQTTVVSDLSLALSKGQCLGLVGESGSGKSLSALSIMQLLPYGATVDRRSEILLYDNNLLNYTEKQMRRIRGGQIGMIFQDAMSAFNPVFTIGNQMAEALKLHQQLSGKKALQKAMQLLEEVGISDPKRTLSSYAHQLSGGMRQRAMIALALAGDPELLIADEPTTALDVTIQAQVIDLLKELKQKWNKTLLFISHDLAVVSNLADEIAVMQNGVKLEHQSTEDFFDSPSQAYSQKLLAAIPDNHPRKQSQKNKQAILTINNLKVHFPIRKGVLKRIKGYVKAVDGVNFAIQQGETLALVGESGSGKTTTGKAIIKLVNSTDGEIIFKQQNLAQLSSTKMRKARDHLQIIFQDPVSALNPRMMVFDCIAEGLFSLKKVSSRKQALIEVDQLLAQVDLPLNSKWRYPHEFSGGQRQRICIARALALKPDLLILDEPTSALDVSIQMQILQLLDDLQQRLNLSYLLITHNLGVVAYLAHKTAVMYQGKIVEYGDTSEILHSPQNDYTKKLIASIPKIIEPSYAQQ